MSKFSNKYELVLNELIYGAYLIALTSSALVLSVTILLGLDISILSLSISFFITLIVYSYNYQYESHTDIVSNEQKVSFLIKREKIFPYLLAIYCIILAFLLILSILSSDYGFIMFIIIILVGGLLYTIVFKVLTKIITSFKSIYVTAMWAYAGTFFVYFYYNLHFDYFSIFMFIYMFLKLFINVVHFDIKDISSDKIKNLKTIPIVIGVKSTYNILNVINLISLIVLCYAVYMKIFPLYTISLALFTIYVYYYLRKGTIKNSKELIKYTYFMVDGECLLWPILLLISKYAFNFFLH